MNKRIEVAVALTIAALVLLVVAGCSGPTRSAAVQTEDRTGVSSYGTEWPPAYHKWLKEESRMAGR